MWHNVGNFLDEVSSRQAVKVDPDYSEIPLETYRIEDSESKVLLQSYKSFTIPGR